MYILGSGCGWIPDAPVKFMYHIINLIKNLTPVILIIMGSLDFGKAVISQKEEEIKRAQVAFIKKLIAGAAVFFVIVFARWVLTIIDNTGQADTSDAFKCVSLLLKGSYEADDKTYYEGPDVTKKTTTTSNNQKYENYNNQEIFDILKSCDSFKISSTAGLDCVNARNSFCTNMFSDSTCRNFCNGIDFSTAELDRTFGGSHPTGANGCKIENISDYINKNIEDKPQQDDELESCTPPNCDCKYQDNKNKCESKKEQNQQTDLDESNCVTRLDQMIKDYCVDDKSQPKNDYFDDFINDYGENYKDDGLSEWLESGDAEQFFTYEGKFNCGRAYSTKTFDLSTICKNRVNY